jgi:hypothetical protein
MSTLLDEPATRRTSDTAPAQRLRTTMAAMRLSFTWFGTRKTLSPQQKAQAAESFGAEGEYLSAGKKLLNVRHPKFKAVTQIRGRASQFWKSMSLPFPEPGLRLIRQDDVASVNVQMTTLKAELEEAVEELNRHYEELKSSARQRLGNLYNESDYPVTLIGLFDLAWEFPSVEPPDYLQRLSPELYRQECERMQSRFNEAVQLAEAAFTEELAKLVEHLSDRLTGQQDGKPKVFRDTAITNLTEFFQRFQRLNVRSNEQLDELVAQAQEIVRGVQPQQLRENLDLRVHVAEQLENVQQVLGDLLVDRPRRNILRKPR